MQANCYVTNALCNLATLCAARSEFSDEQNLADGRAITTPPENKVLSPESQRVVAFRGPALAFAPVVPVRLPEPAADVHAPSDGRDRDPVAMVQWAPGPLAVPDPHGCDGPCWDRDASRFQAPG